MACRLIVAAVVAWGFAALPPAGGQTPVGEPFVIEPIVIGGDTFAEDLGGDLLLDPTVVPDDQPGGGRFTPDSGADGSGHPFTEAGQGGCGSCGHGAGGHGAALVREYVVFDVLFLDRDNATANQSILTDGAAGLNPGSTIFTTRSLVPTTGPGVRLFVGRHGCDTTGWEVGYWGVYGWFGDARADVVRGLAVPGDLGLAVPGWDAASTVKATWSSTLNVTEWNLLSSSFGSRCEPCSPWPQRRCRHETEVDWIGGLFWAGLEEQAGLAVAPVTGGPASSYRVATSSNLLGGQLGVRGRRTWDRFTLEGWLKAGLGGAWLSQSAAPVTSVLAPNVVYRPARSAVDTGTGFLSTMNLSMAYRFNETWGLRLGYNLAWISGVALAPNQWDFTDTATSGTGVRGAGGLFLHGANVGLEARW